jgi:hypothetical protein
MNLYDGRLASFMEIKMSNRPFLPQVISFTFIRYLMQVLTYSRFKLFKINPPREIQPWKMRSIGPYSS